ncbi:MAG: hypothetical protein V1676_01330 [Candidatus Diapherotrites archaeon]
MHRRGNPKFVERLAMLRELRKKAVTGRKAAFVESGGGPNIRNIALSKITKKERGEISKWARSRGFAPTHTGGVPYRGATNYIHGIYAEELDNVPLRRRIEKTAAMDRKLKGKFIRMFGNARNKFGRGNVATWEAEKFMKAIAGKEKEKQETLLSLMEEMVGEGHNLIFLILWRWASD